MRLPVSTSNSIGKRPTQMGASALSFLRHGQIYQSDVWFASNWRRGSAQPRLHSHRLDEFAVGYSLADCSPAGSASALPTGPQCAVHSSYRSRNFHRTANCVLTGCLTPGGRPIHLHHPYSSGCPPLPSCLRLPPSPTHSSRRSLGHPTLAVLQVLFGSPTTDRASLAISLALIGSLTPVLPGDSASSPEVTRCSSVPCRPQSPWWGG